MFCVCCLYYSVASCGTTDYLSELDHYIEIQGQLTKQYSDSLFAMSRIADSLSDRELYVQYKELYNGYSSYKYDSAFHYAKLNRELAEQIGDKELVVESWLHIGHILSVAGLFTEALEALQTVEPLIYDTATQIIYLSYLTDLFLYKAEFTGEPYSSQYMSVVTECRQRVIEIAPKNSYEYLFAYAANRCEAGDYKTAISTLEGLLPQLRQGTREYSVVTGTLGYFYHFTDDREKQKEYFALSAISDFIGCIRETNSLRALAVLLYEDGMTERAYRYLWTSVRDAQFYGSRLRTFQTGQITPIIVQAWLQEQTQHQRAVTIILISSLAFIVVLIIGIIVIVIYMHKYHRANEAMHIANKQLDIANKIKIEYLSRFMRLSSDYIAEAEQNRRHLVRLIRDNKQKELAEILNSPELAHTNVKRFTENFDEAFLKIYPTFIEKVNKLLLPEQQIVIKTTDRLTTELRIFALIRLGINDNQEIAGILRSTLTTVYTYRSRFRMRAIDKDHFEQQIMLIE